VPAYAFLQGTKPQTLAYALTDSPIGLAAWIAEKFRSWSDCGGELESVIPLDTLLTDISLYWFGNTIEASLRIYKENRLCPLVFGPRERITPPLALQSSLESFPCHPAPGSSGSFVSSAGPRSRREDISRRSSNPLPSLRD
jgi:hypothetical protein